MNPSRTTVAMLLAGAAVTIPCVAWYFAGARAADQRGVRVEAAARQAATAEASRIAEQLTLRLESLRQTESRRPYSDYLSDGQLVTGDCAAEPQFASPLARGPADPLIWAHFQIDDVGQLSLPTLVDDRPAENGAADAREIQAAIFEELECASSHHLAALRRKPQAATERRVPAGGGVITVGAFEWHSASLQGQPAFVALREVATPTAALTQGFVVLAGSLERLQAAAPYPVRVLAGKPSGDAEARLALTGDAWTVHVDASSAMEQAAVEAGTLRSRFRKTFVAGSIGAMLAGVAVVFLVWQTDRLALQRSRFAAAAAHELRTPLAGLQLYAEMLADGSGAPEQTANYPRRIALEAERLGRVVGNVLGFSRLERTGLGQRGSVGDLASAVRESLERIRPGLEANGATLDVAIDSDLAATHFDRDSVHQMLQNLLDNAERYSRQAADRRITVALNRREAGQLLSVVDRGPGVDPSVRRRLFRPFLRHPDPAAPEGLGIGLALVRAMARSQGAEVSHTQPDAGGSVFSILFPTPP